MRAALIAAIFSCGCAAQSRLTLDPQEILAGTRRAEDLRDAFAPAISRGAGAKRQPDLRIAAMLALARIEESGTIPLVTPLLSDPDPEVANLAAFAAGQIGGPHSEPALLGALSGTPVIQALRSLGRAATATGARSIAELLTDTRAEVRAASALALALIGKRVGPELPAARHQDTLSRLVRESDPLVRSRAVYALMRLPAPGGAEALAAALADADPEARANAARGLGASRAAAQTLDAVAGDPDWRVRFEAARALGVIGADEASADAAAQRLVQMAGRELERFRIGGALGSGRATHVLLAIIEAAIALGDPGASVLRRFEKERWPTTAPASARDRARILCALAYALDASEGVIRRVKNCGDASLLAWRRFELEVRLLSRTGEPGLGGLIALIAHPDTRVRTAAADALGEIASPKAAATALELLGHGDPYVVAAAAGALSRPGMAAVRPPGIVDQLRSALGRMAREPDPNFGVSVLDAIAGLGRGGAPLSGELASLLADPRHAVRRRAAAASAAIRGEAVRFGAARAPSDRPPPLAGRPRARLVTTRGEIVIELYGDVAPKTVGTFVALAKKRFYDGKTFHRVVGDFVVQGGCPRGDGWGGPGYAIDDETSPLPFVRGAVGIATNGRDTGGSQFFIMHSEQPHLDGGYTLFGRVLEGMDVVDAIQVDDVIESIAIAARTDGLSAK